MARSLTLSLALLVVTLPARAGDPPAPDDDAIRLPVIAVPPPPPPPPPPAGSPVRLPAGVYYVVTSAKPFFALASPPGRLTVEQGEGPLTLRGRFVEDPEKVVTRKVTAKYYAIVEAAEDGPGELIVVPSGVTDAKRIVRQMLDCQVSPRPPPVPPPPPTPADPFTAALQAAYAADAAPDKAKSLGFLQSAYKGMAAAVPATARTNADLFAWMKAVVEAPAVGLPADKLTGVRRAIAADLTAAFGTAPATPVDPIKAAAELSRVAAALAGVR